MTDADFVERFEKLSLPPRDFDHRAHVRLAFLYTRDHGLVGALDRYRTSLRRFAEHHRVPEKYHETVTCALVVLIHERVARSREEAAGPLRWPDFADDNPDLLRWLDGAFFEYYPRSVLQSDFARKVFVLPTRVPAEVVS